MPKFSATAAVKETDLPPIPLVARWAAAYHPDTNANRPLLPLSQGVPGSPPHPHFINSLQQVSLSPFSSTPLTR